MKKSVFRNIEKVKFKLNPLNVLAFRLKVESLVMNL